MGNVVGSRGSQRTGYVGRRMEGLGPILEEANPGGLTVEGSRIRQWVGAAGHHVMVTWKAKEGAAMWPGYVGGTKNDEPTLTCSTIGRHAERDGTYSTCW